MNRITHKQFLQKLKNSDSTIIKELYSQWKNWLYDEYAAYEYNENLLLIEGKDKYKVDMFIFNYDSCKELLKKYKNDNNCTDLCVSLIGKLPEELDKYYGWRCFERIGINERMVYDNIKLLTKEDKNDVFELCNRLLKQGNFSSGVADDLQSYIENEDDKNLKNKKTYGYYNGDMLIGFVIIDHFPSIHYSHLSTIGVLEEYRRNGIGTKLSKFVLSLYPDEKYHYQASHLNKASIRLAISLGFKFAGVRELIIK